MMDGRLTDCPRDRNASLAVEAALAVPALIWLIGAGMIAIFALAGYRALAAPADLTLSEAATIRDVAEVLRQIRAGADPNAPTRVRPGFLREAEYRITPLEAATVARHLEVVQLLVRNGATLNDSNFMVLFCLAQANKAEDIALFLQAYAPPRFVLECGAIRLPL